MRQDGGAGAGAGPSVFVPTAGQVATKGVSAPWLARTEEAAPPVPVSSGRPPGRRLRLGPRRAVGAFRYRNAISLSAIGLTLVYVAIAFVVHFLILGFVPALVAVRALRRREPLARLAILVAVIPFVLFFVRLH